MPSHAHWRRPSVFQDPGAQGDSSLAVQSMPVVARLVLGTAVTLLWVVGYFWVGRLTPISHLHEIASPLDARIPFAPQAVWLYLCVFPLALSPLIFARDARLMRRTALAYGVTIVVSFLCFLLYPVAATGLRPAMSATGLSATAVRAVYAVDTSHNLCPSLHVSLAVLAALSATRARGRRTGLVFVVAAGAIAVSTCLIKQHFLADVVAGAALAAVTGSLTLVSVPRAQGK